MAGTFSQFIVWLTGPVALSMIVLSLIMGAIMILTHQQESFIFKVMVIVFIAGVLMAGAVPIGTLVWTAAQAGFK